MSILFPTPGEVAGQAPRLLACIAASLLIFLILSLNSGFGASSNFAGRQDAILSATNTVCLGKTSLCENIPLVFKDSLAPTAPVQPKLRQSAASTYRPTKTTCSASAQADTAYKQALLSALSQTNAAVDSARSAAITSGESYTGFDSAANAIFTAYNAQAEQIYTNYLQSLDGCQATQAAPQLFSMFNP